MSMTPEARTLASEVRAVERGNHARLVGDGHTILVASESEPGVNRRVRVATVGGVTMFTCSCPAGRDRPATVPCVHGSSAARRLLRAGILRWSGGRWVPTVVVAPAPLRLVMPGAPRVEL